MAYQIDRYNNTLLTVVDDGTIDQTTDLKFIGKNYSGYGELHNENFLFLLENFSGINEPARPLSGQVWFDLGSSKLKFYDGAQWRSTGGSETSGTQPTGLSVGDFWWNSSSDQLYVYNGINFVLVGPQNVGNGVTQLQSIEVVDATGAVRNLISATVNDEVIFVINAANNFTLGVSTPILGFDGIKRGVTLKWTRLADDGVTNSQQVAGNDFRYWGTASNAEKLGGISAENFATRDLASFDSLVEFPDAGIAIGDSNDLQLNIENGNQGVIQNVTGQNSIIKIKVTNGAGAVTPTFTFGPTGMLPATDNVFNLGSLTNRIQDVYAANFRGEAVNATNLRVGSNFRTASVTAIPNTIAVRDPSGNLSATLFQGTATQARYADLAEIYSTNKTYPVGTVVSVCAHNDHDVGAANAGEIAIGVISENPAYLMNSDAPGQAVGLKGRVPVRVVGMVKKGQAVYVHGKGTACTSHTGASMVGIALESSNDENEKLVECVLKV